MDKIAKSAVIACYAASGLIVLAIAAMLLRRVDLAGFSEDGSEFSGSLSAILMAFEMAIFLGMETIKRRLLPKSIQKHGVMALKYLRMLHIPAGMLALSVLAFHVLLAFVAVFPLLLHLAD